MRVVRRSGLARKIVDIPAADMTREWREWQVDDDKITLLEDEEKRLDIRRKVKEAIVKDRLYGGAALVIGNGDNRPQDELKPESIGKGGLKFVHVLTRWEITAGELDRDPMSPFFGEPKYYQLATGTASVQIHPSRVIRFVSYPRPSQALTVDGWGDSVLQIVYDAVHHAAKVQAAVAALIDEARIDVVSVPNLMANIGSDDERSKLLNRFALANVAKGQNSILLLDKEETWEQKQLTFATLPDLLHTYLQIAAGAADIPATRLLGDTPSGMSKTGEFDIQNYYDSIGGKQDSDIRPRLERLDQFLVRSALGSTPDGLWWDFAPLWQMSEKDQATVDLQRAQATEVYVTSALIPSDALAEGVANQLTEAGTYPGLDKAIAKSKQKLGDPSIKPPSDPSRDPAKDPNNPDNKPNARLAAKDAEPQSLYVSRSVKNAADIIAWAKKQGFKSTLASGDLHVTIAFSRQPVDWMKVGAAYSTEKNGDLIVPPGGPRIVEALGDKGAIVLEFSSWELSARHGNIIEAGASWDYDSYTPHITITYSGDGMDLTKLEPYRGQIVLGPEKFEQVAENWEQSVKEQDA